MNNFPPACIFLDFHSSLSSILVPDLPPASVALEQQAIPLWSERLKHIWEYFPPSQNRAAENAQKEMTGRKSFELQV